VATTTRKLTDRIRIGIGLASITFAIVIVASLWIVRGTDVIALKVLIGVLAAVLIAVPWYVAVRNGRVERDARNRLRGQHPGSLVERVRLWTLPAGRVDADIPMHFMVADARELSFETIDQTVQVRVPVAEIGFLGLARAQGDRARDSALTIVYGDDPQMTVQLFTVSYDGMPRFEKRVRTAIGWPAKGTPEV
jgi:4-amino-4-deoxy-L-arabinose transferase-like glycosyltransferase